VFRQGNLGGREVAMKSPDTSVEMGNTGSVESRSSLSRGLIAYISRKVVWVGFFPAPVSPFYPVAKEYTEARNPPSRREDRQ